LSFEILEGRTLLSFSPAIGYPIGLDPQTTAAGDFNNDGHTDLVAANRGETTVSLLIGNGDGTFQAARSVELGRPIASVLAGDLNGDAKIDLVAVNNDSRAAR
jgi:hypothetical protein